MVPGRGFQWLDGPFDQRRGPVQALPFSSRMFDGDIAIVGGGNGGAMCGERLARLGMWCHDYDEHLACGELAAAG